MEPQAVEQLARIPNPDKRRIGRRIERLAEDPRPSGCEKLDGQVDAYRIRQGSYRIVYWIDDSVRIVTITKIGQRGSVYR